MVLKQKKLHELYVRDVAVRKIWPKTLLQNVRLEERQGYGTSGKLLHMRVRTVTVYKHIFKWHVTYILYVYVGSNLVTTQTFVLF
jgi:hypothetical protein